MYIHIQYTERLVFTSLRIINDFPCRVVECIKTFDLISTSAFPHVSV